MNEVQTQKDKEVALLNPACSICEEADNVMLRIEMPGVNKEGLNVHVEKNELIISGAQAFGNQDGKYLLRERRAGEFRKRFIIDETIDRDKIEAQMKDGILQLVLQKREAAKPRKVEIR